MRLAQLRQLATDAALAVKATRRAPDAIRVACVGDSITFGAGIPRREWACYPAVLESLLGRDFHVRNFGVSGATLLRAGDRPYWEESALAAATAWRPQVVVLLLGTNDSKPQNWAHAAEFEPDANDLITHFSTLKSRPEIFPGLPPPAFSRAFDVDESVLGGQRKQLRAIAAKRNLTVIDLHAPLVDHPEHFPDTIHPNAAGAAVIAREVAAAVKVTSRR